MTERTVIVWGEPQRVALHQQSPTVWVAVGDYMGQRIETKDRTMGAVLKRWREAATYCGNG